MKRSIERFKRLKYKGGHNVHSPFVFRLIQDAVEAREMTYRLEGLLNETSERKSYYALLYRLVRHLEVGEVHFIGHPSNGEARFTQAAVETTDKPFRKLFLITADCSAETVEKALPELKRSINTHCIVMVCDLFESATAQQAWRRIKTELPVRTSIDVMDFGLLFFDPALHEQEYKLYR